MKDELDEGKPDLYNDEVDELDFGDDVPRDTMFCDLCGHEHDYEDSHVFCEECGMPMSGELP